MKFQHKLLIALCGLSLGACVGEPPSGGGQTKPGAEPNRVLVTPGLRIDSVEAVSNDAFPLQITVLVRGVFSNACVDIGDVQIERRDDRFNLRVLPTAPTSDSSCGDTPQDFEQLIPLPMAGLKAGLYRVDVNGKDAQFNLTADHY